MSDESTGRLPAQIAGNSKRVRESLASLTGHLHAIRSLVERPRVTTAEQVTEICGAAKMDVIVALAELNALDTSIAAGRMTGQVITEPRAQSLELHPVRQLGDREQQLMLRSLHRAGDHSLDGEGEA